MSLCLARGTGPCRLRGLRTRQVVRIVTGMEEALRVLAVAQTRETRINIIPVASVQNVSLGHGQLAVEKIKAKFTIPQPA